MSLFKKVISIVLGICLLLSMTACGAAGNPETQYTEPSQAPEPEIKQPETDAQGETKPVSDYRFY